MGIFSRLRARRAARKKTVTTTTTSKPTATIVSTDFGTATQTRTGGTTTAIVTSGTTGRSSGGGRSRVTTTTTSVGTTPQTLAASRQTTTPVSATTKLQTTSTRLAEQKAIITQASMKGLSPSQTRQARDNISRSRGASRFEISSRTLTNRQEIEREMKRRRDLAKETLRRQGIEEAQTPLADSIRDVPFFNKTLGEAFAPEGFRKESKIIVTGKKKIVEAFGFAAKQIVPTDFLFKKETRANLSDVRQSFSSIASGSILQLVPETPGQLIVTAGGTALAISAPPVFGGTLGAGFGILGGRTALDTSLTTEQRVAGALVAVGGATGSFFAAKPFVKGGIARITGKGKVPVSESLTVGKITQDVKVLKGFESIQENIATFKGDALRQAAGELPLGGTSRGKFDIGLIPEGEGVPNIPGSKPGEGALIRGGKSQFPPSEQIQAFGGKFTRGASSQADFPPTDGVFVSDPTVSEFGTFFSPADPITGVPQTRASRIGLTDLFKAPDLKAAKFGLGSDVPRILITEPTRAVAGTPKAGEFKISPKGTTELEITTTENLEIVNRPGVAILKGQAVEVFEVKLAGSKPITPRTGSSRVGDVIPSSPSRTTISLTSFNPSTGIITGKFNPQNIKIRSSSTSSTSIKTIIIPSPSPPSTIRVTGSRGSGRTSRGVSSSISSPISSPISPSVAIPTSPKISTPISPSISPPISSIISPPIIPRITPIIIQPPRKGFTARSVRFPRRSTRRFGVQVRRGGIFRSVGSGLTAREAKSLGQNVVGGTLAATFKVTGRGNKRLRTPAGFFSKATDDGVLFIEKRGKRLSKKTETKEIQAAKRKKKEKKRKPAKKKKK